MKILSESLLNEFRTTGKCEKCGRPYFVRDPHHISARGLSSGKRLDLRINLIALCRTCHSIAHNDGGELNKMFLKIVAAREETTVEAITEIMDMLRRLVKPTPAELNAALGELSDEANLLGWKQLEGVVLC